MTAVFLDFSTLGHKDLDPSPLLRALPQLELFESTPPSLVGERIAGQEFVFVNKVRLGKEELQRADSLRYIGVAATGTDNIDKEFARERGIAVTNIQRYCTQSVVEHVIGVMLMMTHSLQPYRDDVVRGDWQRAGTFCLLSRPIRELSALTMGIVGYGELGRAVGEAASRLGMRVLVSARPGEPPAADGYRVNFETLLGEVDVLTLHCPLTAATRGLINRDTLGKMKPDAYLINTARGALVDSGALIDALDDRRLAGAAIDVLAEEPPGDDEPLLSYQGDRLILTPHIAWSSVSARQQAVNELATNVSAFQEGRERCRVA